jgi:hypothetical protein
MSVYVVDMDESISSEASVLNVSFTCSSVCNSGMNIGMDITDDGIAILHNE